MPFLEKNNANVEQLPQRVRVIVIGGGIHGLGVAHDLASRMWKDTLVLEKDTLGSATSSASTKLIHGGLRYLKRISQFSMVSKSLRERKLLTSLCPDLVKPIELIYPVVKDGGLPSIFVRIGLMLYDFLSGRNSVGKHRKLSVSEALSKVPGLKTDLFKSFYSFWDCQTDDLALCCRVASSAVNLGATIAEGIEVTRVGRFDNGWTVDVLDSKGRKAQISALYIVNCAGPWANVLLERSGLAPKITGINNRGSHIIVRDLGLKTGVFFESPRDNRIFFVLPWKHKTLIGTTEKIFEKSPDDQVPTDEDIDYLLKNTNDNLSFNLQKEDIIYKFSGLRWLAAEGGQGLSKTSREVVISSHDSERGFLLTIYGGKLTSYRQLSEDIGDEITRHFGAFKRTRTNRPSYWVNASDQLISLGSLDDRFSKFSKTSL